MNSIIEMNFSFKVYSTCLYLLITSVFMFTQAEAKSPIKLGENESWMGIYFKGRKLGFSYTLLSATSDSVQINSKIYIHLKDRGKPQTTSFNQETRLTPNLRLIGFSFLETIGDHRQQISGHLKGDQLIIKVTTRGYQKTKSILFPIDAALSTTYIFNLLYNGLEVGEKNTFPIFVEALQTFSTVEYEVLRKETLDYGGSGIETLVILQNIGGMESTLWVTEGGNILRESSPQGFEFLKETKETAQNLNEETMSVSSFITLSLIKAKKKILNSASRKKGRYKLSNLSAPNLIPKDHRQDVLQITPQGGRKFSTELIVTTEILFEKPPLHISELSFPEKTLLSDSPKIQSSHPSIKSLAREIIKDEINSWQAAKNINAWVFKNIEKILVDSFTALDALREKRGECQSHTNLFVALARAGGIPSKVVNGLAYSRDYNGFVYHAWPEVFVGEWRALDPTLGQYNVDATHIKLFEGEKDDPFKMMEFFGKLQIEIMDN